MAKLPADNNLRFYEKNSNHFFNFNNFNYAGLQKENR